MWRVKAHIPQETVFTFGDNEGKKRNKQHKIFMPNMSPEMNVAKVSIFRWHVFGLAFGIALGSQFAFLFNIDLKHLNSLCRITLPQILWF